MSEWLTFLVSASSLVISYLTYENAADTSNIKHAVSGLARLADQTKRQADALGSEVKAISGEEAIMAAEFGEMRGQTGQLASQAKSAREANQIAQHTATEQFSALSRQSSTLDEQLAELREERRPWLTASTHLARSVYFERWNSPFTQIQVNLTFTLRNLGRSPAENVRIAGGVFKHPGNNKFEIIAQSQERYCAEARKQADEKQIGDMGIAPGETRDVSLGFGNFAPPGGAMYSVHGCIDYTYDSRHDGQVGFRMILGRIVGGGWQVISTPTVFTPWPDYSPLPGWPKSGPVETTVSAKELSFEEDPSGGNFNR